MASATGITSAQAKAGDVKGAKATAKTIEDASSRASALNKIASAQAKAGDVKGAKETITQALVAAKTIEDEDAWFRASALEGVASVLAALK